MGDYQPSDEMNFMPDKVAPSPEYDPYKDSKQSFSMLVERELPDQMFFSKQTKNLAPVKGRLMYAEGSATRVYPKISWQEGVKEIKELIKEKAYPELNYFINLILSKIYKSKESLSARDVEEIFAEFNDKYGFFIKFILIPFDENIIYEGVCRGVPKNQVAYSSDPNKPPVVFAEYKPLGHIDLEIVNQPSPEKVLLTAAHELGHFLEMKYAKKRLVEDEQGQMHIDVKIQTERMSSLVGMAVGKEIEDVYRIQDINGNISNERQTICKAVAHQVLIYNQVVLGEKAYKD